MELTKSNNAINKVNFGHLRALSKRGAYVVWMTFFKARIKILPLALCLVFKNLLTKKGTMVSDTSKEAITDVTMARGNPLVNSPGPPGKKTSGGKAMIRV